VVESLRGRTRPGVRLSRHEERHLHTATGGGLDPPDHPSVADVRIGDLPTSPKQQAGWAAYSVRRQPYSRTRHKTSGTTEGDPVADDVAKRSGWITFAGVMAVIAGA
jgi:hypothetical protein